MSSQNIARLFSKSASTSLFLVFFLTSNLICSDGSLMNILDIFWLTNPMRPETTIAQGTLRGINMETRHERKIFGFLGVPYAQPPIGNLRFKAPVPPKPWNGTLDVNRDSEPCIQINDEAILYGSEDCLYLNVFTPQLPTSQNSTLMPVMVYITGGRFQTGNNTVEAFNPGFLLDEDVILVVPNYRVGVLGFLSTGDEVSPGNYGLKDIVQVLKWVQDNIQYFGGNPNQVTLFGGSSGAMSVHLLALSRLTDGLFHRYITQSGSALCNTVNQPREVCVERAIKLGEYVGCPTSTSWLLVNCLRGLNASQIVDTYSIFYAWGPYWANVWLPTSEPEIEGALLTDTPVNVYAAGKFHDLPWLATVDRDEGLHYAMPFYDKPELFEDLLENLDSILPYLLEYVSLVDDVPAHTQALKSYYLNDLTADRSQLLLNFTKLIGDAKFVYPMYKASKTNLVFAKSLQYFGSFEYRGTYSPVFDYHSAQRYTGIPHNEELVYLFGYRKDRFGPPDSEYTKADWLMVDTVVQLWTSFAKNGIPTTAESISTTIWKPYSSLNNYLRIGNGYDTALEMKYDLYLERMQFWDELNGVTPSSGEYPKSMSVLAIVLCICLSLCLF